MSPFAKSGIRTCRLTSAIVRYSASPSKRHARVRPWIASAAMPESSAMRAIRTALRVSRSHPVRIFSVTGTVTADTTAARMRATRGSSRSSAEPASRLQTFLAGTSHVEVDDLRARVYVAARGVGHRVRIATRDLHDPRLGLVGVIATTARQLGIPEPFVGRRASRPRRAWRPSSGRAVGTAGR